MDGTVHRQHKPLAPHALCSSIHQLLLLLPGCGWGARSSNMQALQLKPTVGALSSTKSSFRGVTAAFQRLSIAQQPAARQQLVVEGEQRAEVLVGAHRHAFAY